MMLESRNQLNNVCRSRRLNELKSFQKGGQSHRRLTPNAHRVTLGVSKDGPHNCGSRSLTICYSTMDFDIHADCYAQTAHHQTFAKYQCKSKSKSKSSSSSSRSNLHFFQHISPVFWTISLWMTMMNARVVQL